MARSSKISEGMIEQICKYVKLRLKWKEIAENVGLHPATLRNWIDAGKKAKSGIKRQLVDAIAQAESEYTADLSQVISNAALFGSRTVTEEEIRLPDGTTRTKTTTKWLPPSASEARKELALMHPDRWAEIKHIKYEWKESLENIGLDPKKIEDGFFKEIENREDDTDEVVIPLIEEKTV